MQNHTITVLGTGYVGLTTATLLAHCGHRVYAVEPNQERLNAIKQGRSFFFEEGLDPLVDQAVKHGTLIPTESYEESVPNSDIVFSCVGTPDAADGSLNLEYVFGSATEAAKLLKDGAIFVQKSTVPVGTGDKVKEIFSSIGKNIAYVSNPEFLRESTALADTLWFDRIVVGSSDHEAAETILDLYRELSDKREIIASRTSMDEPRIIPTGEYIETSQNSAELIKVTSNAFLALKITFANSIAMLADKTGADIKEVMNGVGADLRIGRAFLNAGRGYGGGCFPKDVSGLIASSKEFGVDNIIMEAAAQVNAGMPSYIINKVKALMPEGISSKKVAVLGLAFKAGTSDTRKSPAIKIANQLIKEGAAVNVYDPQAYDEAKETLDPNHAKTDSIEQCLSGTEAVFVATDWDEFKAYAPEDYAKQMAGKIFADCMNVFDIPDIKTAGLTYVGVGRQ